LIGVTFFKNCTKIRQSYQAPDLRQLQSLETPQQRLLVNFHVFKLKNHWLKVIRAFTMPQELTIAFLSAVQEQYANAEKEVICHYSFIINQ
jgi:hypothetical protein